MVLGNAASVAAKKVRRQKHLDAVQAGYGIGKSVLTMARDLSVSRGMIVSCLADLGLEPRSGSEASRIRMEREGPEGRLALTDAAHAAVKGKPVPAERLARQAKVRQATLAKVGSLEAETMEGLALRGVRLVPQLAVGSFNLDIARWPFAVEIHRCTNDPSKRPITLRRVRVLRGLGWSVAYLWLRPEHDIEELAFDTLSVLDAEARFLPVGETRFWIVRADGQLTLVT